MATASPAAIATVRGLSVRLGGRDIVRDVDFDLVSGDRLAIVGGSGSGKTTMARALAGLHPPGAVRALVAAVAGHDLTQPLPRRFHGGVVGYAFQDALATLDPLQRVGAALAEVLAAHQPDIRPAASEASQHDLLLRTGLPHPEQIVPRYPHELSGGQRQRVGLALALAGKPQLLVADEPTSSLDPPLSRAIARQLLHLCRADEARDAPALVLITHDLQLARAVANTVLVLEQGEVVERGATELVLHWPQHPATQVLLEASGLWER